MKDVVWTLAAEADVQEIYERLELREEGFGDAFYADVLHVTRLLAQFPELGTALNHRRLRRVLLNNRHYGLFYVSEARGVVLHALFDLRQDPAMIERRLRGI